MKKRMIGAGAAVILAMAGTMVLLAYVNSAHAKAETGEAQKAVLIVTAPVPKGTPVEQLRQSVVVRAIPVSLIAPSALGQLDTVNGKVTSTALLPGDQVLPERFIAPEQAKRGNVPPGMLEVTVPVPVDRALGGKIEKGDTVGIVMTIGAEGDLPAATHFLLHKVLVTRVQMNAAKGNSAAPRTTAQPAAQPAAGQQQTSQQVAAQENQPQGPEGAPSGSMLLTFALDAPSVERVVYAAEHASLWLAAEPSDAPETGTQIITRKNVQ